MEKTTVILTLLCFTQFALSQTPEKIAELLDKSDKASRKQAELINNISLSKNKNYAAKELYKYSVYSVLPVINKTVNETVLYGQKAKQNRNKEEKLLKDIELFAIYLNDCRQTQKNIINHSQAIYLQVSDKHPECSNDFSKQRHKQISDEYYRFQKSIKKAKNKLLDIIQFENQNR